MGLYQVRDDKLLSLRPTTYQTEGIQERSGLQALVRDSIRAIDDDLMVLAEEFSSWEDSKRRIDLLCLDREARLVVVELKRTEVGGHMELQAIRYAAMVSKMTFSEAVDAHGSFLAGLGRDAETAESAILEFLGWPEPQEEAFGAEVRMILASADFSNELMTAVIWLSDREVDITCMRLKPYRLGDDLVLNVEQIFPLREAADYQVRIREKHRRERQAAYGGGRDTTRFDLRIGEQAQTNLFKYRLAHAVVKEAVERGADPRDVLNARSVWVAVDGELSSEDFLRAAVTERDSQSPTTDIRHFLTADDELMHHGGKTYALKGNIWGRNTRAELDRIIEEFDLSHASYEAAPR